MNRVKCCCLCFLEQQRKKDRVASSLSLITGADAEIRIVWSRVKELEGFVWPLSDLWENTRKAYLMTEYKNPMCTYYVRVRNNRERRKTC